MVNGTKSFGALETNARCNAGSVPFAQPKSKSGFRFWKVSFHDEIRGRNLKDVDIQKSCPPRLHISPQSLVPTSSAMCFISMLEPIPLEISYYVFDHALLHWVVGFIQTRFTYNYNYSHAAECTKSKTMIITSILRAGKERLS